MYIKDTYTGNVRKYGTDQHDSLRISNDGTCLTYEHLQCGDGSIEGDKEHSGFLFCDDEGYTPEEDEVLCKHGADAFFNVGGWEEPPKWIPVSERLPEDIKPVIVTWKNTDPKSYYQYIVGKHYIGTAHYKGGKWFWYSSVTEDLLAEYGRCDSEEFDEAIEVIAWMPLPKPYEPQERSE